MTLPEPFTQTFDWLEAQGWGGIFTRLDQEAFSSRYLSIYPPDVRDEYGASFVLFRFEAGPPLHDPPPQAIARITTIAKIAGDGGTLSFWLDDDGKQWITVFNHGIPHVLTDDPIVALQFLAIGYSEPGALTDPNVTPLEAQYGDPITVPKAFQDFISATFGVSIPARASDLGIVIPPESAPDPLRAWLDEVMPEPEIGAIPGMTAENPYIVTPELREILGDAGVAALRRVYEFVIEEE
ncbi:hypothetical protein [Gymnodinialimonas ulvae]|uniref:hypothetical protein n=1 Tax=Gymnodinialimonas ulvae TaxID=3126504 RepID=UPI0030EDB122